jgi:hypothetical protein
MDIVQSEAGPLDVPSRLQAVALFAVTLATSDRVCVP